MPNAWSHCLVVGAARESLVETPPMQDAEVLWEALGCIIWGDFPIGGKGACSSLEPGPCLRGGNCIHPGGT